MSTTTKYRKVPYRNKDTVKVICYRGTYKDYKVSIIFSDDHKGWLFYVEKGDFYYNSMRKGILYNSKDATIEEAEKFIDSKEKRRK